MEKKPKGPERHIDDVIKLIEAVLNDAEIVYVEFPEPEDPDDLPPAA